MIPTPINVADVCTFATQTILILGLHLAFGCVRIPSGCEIYAFHLFDCTERSHGSTGNISSGAVRSNRYVEGYGEGDDLGDQCGAEEALTRVENLHSGVRVRMLFMDHLSADLLCEDLPGDRERTQVVNIHIGPNNNRETSLTTEYTTLCICFTIMSYADK